MRRLLRHAFVPLYLAAGFGVLAYRDALGAWMRMDGATVGFFLLLLGLQVAEKLAPADDGWNYNLVTAPERGWTELGRDLLYLFVVTQVSALLVTLSTRQLAPWIPPGNLWPSHAPAPLRLLLAFTVAEFFNYLFHAAAHRVPLLWRFHATHHAVTSLTALKALRTHPLDNLGFHLVRSVPLLALGAPAEDLSGAVYLGGMLGLLSHANLDAAPGPLGWLINFPRYHAVHHAADVATSRHNYGCHTVLFDRLFGTFHDGQPPPFPLGLGPPGPRSAWQELVRPLYGPPA